MITGPEANEYLRFKDELETLLPMMMMMMMMMRKRKPQS